MNYEYTADLENNLDRIATADVDSDSFLSEFYNSFYSKVTQVREKFDSSSSNRTRFLGYDKDGVAVTIIVTMKYGPTIAFGQQGQPDVKYFNFNPENLDSVTLADAIDIIKKVKSSTIPTPIVSYDRDGNNYLLKIRAPTKGNTTPYFDFEGMFYPVLEGIDINNITNEDIDRCINSKKTTKSVLYDYGEFQVVNGKFGPFISRKSSTTYINIDKKYDITNLTKEICLEIIDKSTKKYAFQNLIKEEKAVDESNIEAKPSKKRKASKPDSSDSNEKSETKKKRKTSKDTERS